MRTSIITAAVCLLAVAAAGQNRQPPPPTTAPASRPATLDLSAVLRQLPKEARPPKAGWDDFTRPKAHKWLTGQLAGKVVAIQARVDRVDVDRVPDRADPDKTLAWRRTVRLQSSPVRGLPFPASQSAAARVRGGKPDPTEEPDLMVAYVTEEEARQARDWKQGQALTLAGEVADVEVRPDQGADGPTGRFVVVLLDCTILARK